MRDPILSFMAHYHFFALLMISFTIMTSPPSLSLETSTISAAPAFLPSTSSPMSSPAPALSPDISPLLPTDGPSMGPSADGPSMSTVPTIPSNPSPPNPDEMVAFGPGSAISPSMMPAMASSASVNFVGLAGFVGLVITAF